MKARQFVNVVMRKCDWGSTYSVSRIKPEDQLFYPSTKESQVAGTEMETISRMPAPKLRLKHPISKNMRLDFLPFYERSSGGYNKILYIDAEGRTVLYDINAGSLHLIPCLNGPKGAKPISFSIGHADVFYIMGRCRCYDYFNFESLMYCEPFYSLHPGLQFAERYGDEEDLVCPMKYFMKDVEFFTSLDGNELLKAVGINGKSMVSKKAGGAVRSLMKIMLDNHALVIPLGDSLRLNNLRISRSKGEFVMVEPPKPPYTLWDDFGYTLWNDFGLIADVVEHLARTVLEPSVAFPHTLVDFLTKLREDHPRVELIIYHSMFWPTNLLYWLRVVVDQRFRKDFDSLEHEEKNAIRNFMKELGEKSDDLAKLVEHDEFIQFVSTKTRMGAKNRQGKSNSSLGSEEAVWRERARDVISMNKDGVVHGTKQDLPECEKAAMPNSKKHWRTHKNIIELLHIQFEGLEQTYLDLCYESCRGSEKKVLWRFLGMEELFGESEDTWKPAIDAVNKAPVVFRSIRLQKGWK